MALGGKHAGPDAAARRVVGKMSDDRFAILENMAIAVDDFQWFHKVLLCQWKFASRRLVKSGTIIPVLTGAPRDARSRDPTTVGQLATFCCRTYSVFIPRSG